MGVPVSLWDILLLVGTYAFMLVLCVGLYYRR